MEVSMSAISGWWFVPRDDFSLQPALARGMREGIIDIGPTYIVLLLQLDDEQVICSRRKASSASFRRITPQ